MHDSNNEAMGNITSRGRERGNESDDDEPSGKIKLEAEKITTFSGDGEDWPRWKSRTLCAFGGSGYERVLLDPEYANRHQGKSKIVGSRGEQPPYKDTARYVRNTGCQL